MPHNKSRLFAFLFVLVFLVCSIQFAFAQTQYYLTLEANPPYITDFDLEALTGEGWYISGETASFSAKPIVTDWSNLVQWAFIEWTTSYGEPTTLENPAELLMDGDYTFMAQYEPLSYYLNAITEPAEVQTIDNSAVSGQGWYYSGSYGIVDAKQTIISGPYRYEFIGWDGEDQYYDDEGNPVDLPGNQAAHFMDSAYVMIAHYEAFIDVTWECVFSDTARGTVLKISTNDNLFQFSTSKEDYPITQADTLLIQGNAFSIIHSDSTLNLVGLGIFDSRIDFCIAYAQDKITNQLYLLRDRIGQE